MIRYSDNVGKIKTEDGVQRYESLRYPNFPEKITDQYIITKALDRLDLLAHKWYSDSTKWWIIARANNLAGGSFRVEPGTVIRIPYPMPIYTLEDLMNEAQF